MPENSIDGNWTLNSIDHEPNKWLSEMSFSTWQYLNINFNPEEDEDNWKMTSSNSPDFSIFPPESSWELEKLSDRTQEFKGKIIGSAIEGINLRTYSLILSGNTLIVSTLVEPDCPEDSNCTLEICCDVIFEFTKDESSKK
ncbi:MAG: hypothetical protein SVR94_14235 [Pseudomonadota bacterium]|nr:hypothetical protein [Pseudomonadota bacterium]